MSRVWAEPTARSRQRSPQLPIEGRCARVIEAVSELPAALCADLIKKLLVVCEAVVTDDRLDEFERVAAELLRVVE
jgi:hypothetical protein